MDQTLTIEFDTEDDILIVRWVKPYAAQVTDEVSPGVFARANPKTGTVEGLEILDYSQRSGRLELPAAVAPDEPESVEAARPALGTRLDEKLKRPVGD